MPLSVVIRLIDVTISRASLEERLGLLLERYEPQGQYFYGQIDILEDPDYWSDIVTRLNGRENVFRDLVREGAIGAIYIDIAIAFPDHVISLSSNVPLDVIEVASRAGLKIELSIYRTDSNEK